MTGYKKILCAVDFSDHSKVVAAHAGMLAKIMGGEVIIIYAAPSLSQYVGFHVPPNSIESFVGEIVSGADKTMQSFVDEVLPDVPAKGHIVIGYAAEEILAMAEKENVDLIVMGTQGRKGLDRMLFGSVAEHVVKSAVHPVLTIRPDAVAE
ncbi:MAG: universal stress protein [Pseudomonadota bacterium]